MRGTGLRALLAATLAIGAAACAPASPRLTATPDAATPLEASIFPPHYGQVAIHLSKPAYVALFEVIPGRGASLLYPTSGTGFVQVAETWVPMRYNPQRWLYADHVSQLGHAGYRPAGFGSGAFQPVMQAPRYLFLIASEEPLAVDRLQGEVAAVRRVLGQSQYVSMRVDETLEQLALAVVPYSVGDRWVSDLFVDWGFDWGTGAGFGTSAAFTTLQPVLCATGQIMYAPWTSGFGFQYLPCMPMQWPGIGNPLPVTPPPAPGDSVTPPPADGGRRRAERNVEGERRRDASADASAETAEEARRVYNRLVEEASRRRVADDEFDRALRRDVRLRQNVDRLQGGRGPIVSREPSGRPAPVASTRPGVDAAVARQRADERRRAAERADAARERAAAAERRRAEPMNSRPTVRTEASSPQRERTSSPEPSSSGSSGSSGGRSRVPPSGS